MSRQRRRVVTIRNGRSTRRGVQRRVHPKNNRRESWIQFATGWLFGRDRIRKKHGRRGWWAA
jgi:hypothetical protein